jgi:hypothetical protein
MSCQFNGDLSATDRIRIEVALARYERVVRGSWHVGPRWVVTRRDVAGRPVLTAVDTCRINVFSGASVDALILSVDRARQQALERWRQRPSQRCFRREDQTA